MLVNNAGVAHYMPLAELPADRARELVHVKVVAPTMLTRATVPGMLFRGGGTIINVAGMIAFSGPAPQAQMPPGSPRVTGPADSLRGSGQQVGTALSPGPGLFKFRHWLPDGVPRRGPRGNSPLRRITTR